MKKVISSMCLALFALNAVAEVNIPVVPMSVLAQERKPVEKQPSKQLVPKAEVTKQQSAEVSKKEAGTKVARTDKETKVVTEKYPSKEVRQLPKTQAQKAKAPKIAKNGEAIEDSRAVIEMKPGVTQLVTVARGHLNRIVTPFSTPKAMKIDKNTTTTVRDNVIYVATTSSAPVTMFIREEGSEQVALSLTLIPKKIPPRELFLKLPNSAFSGHVARSNSKAKRWEEGGSYYQRIKKLNRALALNDVPSGYVMRQMRSDERKPLCAQDGLSFDFNNAQIIEGHHLEVVIGTAKNLNSNSKEFIERNCGGYGVRSVAAWPHVVLAPGQVTEVFIVRSVAQSTNVRTVRPTLLRGAN